MVSTFAIIRFSATVAAVIALSACCRHSSQPGQRTGQAESPPHIVAGGSPASSSLFEPSGSRSALDIIGRGGSAGTAGSGRGSGGNGTGFMNNNSVPMSRRFPRTPPAVDPVDEWRGSLRR